MKSLITAIVVFVLSLSICTASYFLATGFAEDILSDLDKIEKAIDKKDIKTAESVSGKAISKTEEANYYMAAVANHSELGDMKNGLLKIHQYIKDNNIPSAKLSLVETKEIFKHFIHSEGLSLENIF